MNGLGAINDRFHMTKGRTIFIPVTNVEIDVFPVSDSPGQTTGVIIYYTELRKTF